MVFCIFCPNLVVLASIGGDLLDGYWNYLKGGKLSMFQVQIDLESQGQSPPPPPPPKKKKNLPPQKKTKKKNNRDLNQIVLHLWSKLGDHSLNSLVQNQTLVTIWRRLPKLVANIRSEFHHLVNTELAVGSLVKWLSIKVAHPCKSDTIWVVYCSPIANGSVQL